MVDKLFVVDNMCQEFTSAIFVDYRNADRLSAEDSGSVKQLPELLP